ncbi:phage tail protein [Pseudomonas sp. S25]|uniref:Phage tail protein n=1 Tax=Pseudomonas maioricensis TaxID=1766623 RepID=A0ABS9ZQX8_9PSED|nr:MULTISPECIES: phage tail tube protein [Pseudomonas]MCD5980514.1 phage tail tube protein [Pseudomonas quasicaspiana]MCI8212581.1 phage tail protein [Pseudomonas sp. S25]
MGQKVAGTCYIKVDGDQLVITGGVEVPGSKVKRETVVKGYFKEEDVTPFVKVDAIKTPGMDMSKITEGTNMTITAEFKDGTSYVLSGAYAVDDVTYTGDDGKLSLKFEGIEGDWQ